MLKRIVKRPVRAAVAAIAPRVWRYRKRSLLVLMYHRVFTKNDPRWHIEQPGMVVSVDAFEMHLEVIRQYFEPVRLGDWIRSSLAGTTVPEHACAVTFDDGWRDNFDNAYPLLRRAGVPATIFLVSDLVGTNHTFWPERLALNLTDGLRRVGTELFQLPEYHWLATLGVATSIDRTGLNRESLDRIVEGAKRIPDTELQQKLDAMERVVCPDAQRSASLLDWRQVGEMVQSRFVDIGSHTRHHIRLRAGLDASVVEDEVVGSKRALEQRLKTPIDLFCYPNGDITPAAAALVQSQYLGACTTTRGWNVGHVERHRMRRIGIHEDVARSRNAFVARLSGWL